MKPILLLLLAGSSLLLSCDKDTSQSNSCECPLEKQKTSIQSTSTSDNQTTASGGSEIVIDVPYIKKVLDARLEISGRVENIHEVSEEVYWEIINKNPQLTEDANAFQATTCALYKIVCEDNSISEQERRQEMRALITKFEERLEKILSLSDTPNNLKDETNTPSEPAIPRTVKKKESPTYLTSKTPSDIAMITLGDKSFLDLGNALGNWLSRQGYSVNSHLFTPQFMTDFGRRMQMGDVQVFQESGTAKQVNCVCVFDQQVKLEESKLADEAFITAILGGKVTIFNLKNNIPHTEPLNLRGAGITTTRAMESLEDKLLLKYADINEKLKQCR
jgi:hypothetical protein